jgi:Zn-dependent peptidase ImmA (M78 family)
MDDDMSTAYINRRIVDWAIKRLGQSVEELATSSLTAENINAWVSGDRLPTEAQAEALSERLRVPYLVLFLDSPPDIDSVDVPDLRSVGSKTVVSPSINFIETLNDVLLRQDWYRERQKESHAKPLAYIGRFGLGDPPEEIAADMRAVLRAERPARNELEDWEEFTRRLILTAEDAGVLVMRSGCVGHATSRPLDVKEFRGFALSDPLAPVVFVNSQDARAAQNFTLAHEFAHLWLNQSGVSNVDMRTGPSSIRNQIEIVCNQVAAEFLVPQEEFNLVWDENLSLFTNVRKLSTYFKVSSLVVLIRALENDRIQVPAFKAAYERAERNAADQEKESEGGQFWNTFPWRVSNRLGLALVESVRKEATTFSEAARLLGLRVPAFETYFRREIEM